MSPEDREGNDALDSLIARYLEAEKSRQNLDRDALIEEHPDLADSLKKFFANHDRMKATASLEEPTLPSNGVGPDDPMIPPDRGSQEEATTPLLSARNVPTILPTPRASQPGQATVGDQVRYFGDYELLEEIARGGMGVVFKARQVNLNRIVALKMILAGQFAWQEDIQRFYTEAEAAAQLDHSGIVPIFEIGEHRGQHYFSMGYVEGESLAHKLTDGPLPPREAAELVEKICDAMAYAHERGVIHRDLKPANILIDQNGQPKVTDFGLAKRTEADSNLTGTGQILGTPAYMPPEQASGNTDVEPLADVYSIGAILYCLLTGRPPFQASSTMDTLLQVLKAEPLPPSRLNPSVPIDLETITLKCLSKEPNKRYASAKTLADELERFLEGRPILARPVGQWERVWRWCRRNRALASTGISAAALLLVIAIAGPIAAFQQAKLKRDAERARDEAQIAEGNTDRALKKETAAKDEARQAIFDLKTSFGFAADRELKHSEALLWFADAAASVEPDSSQHKETLIRLQSWKRLVAVPLLLLQHDGEPLERMEFDRSGRYLATLTKTGVVSVWDSQTGKRLREKSDCHAFHWHPQRDEIAIGFDDGQVRFYINLSADAARSIEIGEPVTALTSTANGTLWAAAGKRISVWDDTADRPKAKGVGHAKPILSLEFSTDGEKILTYCDDFHARLYACDNLDEPSISPLPHRGTLRPNQPLLRPKFCLDGDGILIRSAATATWVDSESGATKRIIAMTGKSLNEISVRPDGKQFLLTGQEGYYQLWNCQSNRLVHSGKEEGILIASDFSPDGLTACFGVDGGGVQFCNTSNGLQLGERIPVAWGNAIIRFAPDGRRLAIATDAGVVTLWRSNLRVAVDAREPDLGSRIINARTRHLNIGQRNSTLILSPDQNSALTSGARYWDGTLRDAKLINPVDCQVIRDYHANSLITSACFSPSGELIAVANIRNQLQFWNRKTAKLLGNPIQVDGEPAELAFSIDGNHLFCLLIDGSVRVIDVKDRRIVRQLTHPDVELPKFSREGTRDGYRRPNGYPVAIPSRQHLTASGDWLVTEGLNHLVCVWNWRTGKLRFPAIELESNPNQVAISRDERFIAVTQNENVELLNFVDGTKYAKLSTVGATDQLLFSDDSARLVAATFESSVFVWDTDTKQRIFSVDVRDQGVRLKPALVDAQGNWMVLAGDRGLRCWSIESGRPLTPTTPISGINVRPTVARKHNRVLVGTSWSNYVDFISIADLFVDQQSELAIWKEFAELVSHAEVRGSIPVALDLNQWLERMLSLRREAPEMLADDWTREDLAQWHESHRVLALKERNWYAADWNLNRLREISGNEDSPYFAGQIETDLEKCLDEAERGRPDQAMAQLGGAGSQATRQITESFAAPVVVSIGFFPARPTKG